MFKNNKMLLVAMAVVLVAAFVAASCSSPTATPVPTATATRPAPTATQAGPATQAPATPTPTQAPPTAAPTPTAGPKVTLVAADFTPDTHAYNVTVEKYAELVRQYTGGQVEFKLYHTGSLIKGTDMLDGVRKGLTDMGAITIAYFPGDLPFSASAGMIPFGWDYEGARTIVPKLRPLFDKEMAGVNMKMLWAIPLAIEWMFNKPVDPSNPSFAGMKIRTPGEPWTSVIKILGGAPVSMASSEIPIALRTRVVDGVTTSLQTYDGWDVYGEAGYVIVTQGFINIGNPWCINLQKFNSLPKNVQDALMKAADEVQQFAIDFSIKADADLIAKGKQKATNFDVLTPDQAKVWKSKVASVDDDFVAKFGDQARQVLALVR